MWVTFISSDNFEFCQPVLVCGHTYLCTELEVHHDDADLRTGHHQDDEDQKQEAKQVVELVLPDGLQEETNMFVLLYM